MRIEARKLFAIAGFGAIVKQIAKQREKTAADLEAVDFHERSALAGRRTDEFALGHDLAIDQPPGAVIRAVISDRVVMPLPPAMSAGESELIR